MKRLLLCLIALVLALPVAAQETTPEATEEPTATPVAWPTPTPWGHLDAPPLVVPENVFGQEYAYGAVQMWNSANQNGAMDIMQTVVLVFIVLGGLVIVLRELNKDGQ